MSLKKLSGEILDGVNVIFTFRNSRIQTIIIRICTVEKFSWWMLCRTDSTYVAIKLFDSLDIIVS